MNEELDQVTDNQIGDESQEVLDQGQAPNVIDQSQTEDTQPQDFFTVKYNKEDRQVGYDEAPEYIQKGLNYEKVSQRASEYEANLDRIARLSGYESHDEMVAALDEIERQQEEEKYRQAGIDPIQFQQLVSELPEMQQFRAMQQQQRENEQFQAEAQEFFREFPDVAAEDVPPEVWDLKERTGISILDAYLRTTYKTIGQQKEQEAIQKLQQNQRTTPGALNGGQVDHTTSISNLSSNDFNAMVEKALRGEIKQL